MEVVQATAYNILSSTMGLERSSIGTDHLDS
jgi:hypothetical protein